MNIINFLEKKSDYLHDVYISQPWTSLICLMQYKHMSNHLSTQIGNFFDRSTSPSNISTVTYFAVTDYSSQSLFLQKTNFKSFLIIAQLDLCYSYLPMKEMNTATDFDSSVFIFLSLSFCGHV